VQKLTSYSCSATTTSYKGDKFRIYLAQFSRFDAGQTDDRRDDRCIRLLHLRIYGPYIRSQKVCPYIRAAYTAPVYGPYILVVCTELKRINRSDRRGVSERRATVTRPRRRQVESNGVDGLYAYRLTTETDVYTTVRVRYAYVLVRIEL